MNTRVPLVLVPRFARLIGSTAKAVEHKIARGVWLEGEVWHRAPDGRLYISVEGHKRWVESGRA